jgi:beta-carotene 15,15'-dioxygenase
MSEVQKRTVLKNSAQRVIEKVILASTAIGCLLVIWQWYAGGIPVLVQGAVFAVFIFLTGIPHGAIDHLIAQETAKRQQKGFNLPLFLLNYLLTMLFYGMMWYFLPGVSLLFFLVISAWHFGETDIANAPSTALWNLTRFLFGCFVLLWILLYHAPETAPILLRISQESDVVMPTWSWLASNKGTVLINLGTLTAVAFVLAHRYTPKDLDQYRFLRLCAILVLTFFLPLLPAFGLYFGGWHALCSFKNIHEYLLEERTDGDLDPVATLLSVWRKTILFTLVAVAFLGLATWYWLRYLNSWDPLPLLFIFLSMITLPHLGVMHKMDKSK